jgi:hypothetical protein
MDLAKTFCDRLHTLALYRLNKKPHPHNGIRSKLVQENIKSFQHPDHHLMQLESKPSIQYASKYNHFIVLRLWCGLFTSKMN